MLYKGPVNYGWNDVAGPDIFLLGIVLLPEKSIVAALLVPSDGNEGLGVCHSGIKIGPLPDSKDFFVDENGVLGFTNDGRKYKFADTDEDLAAYVHSLFEQRPSQMLSTAQASPSTPMP